MKLYNTLGKKTEPFVPLNKDKVLIYCCGPTVYNFAHIGNLRTYIFNDILRRILLYNGFPVKEVMNLTDVEDKIIKNIKKENLPLLQYTEKYTDYFFEDCKKLNIEDIEIYTKATDNIDKMQEIIEYLIKKGFAYESEDGIYYDIKKFKDYGRLSGVKLDKNSAWRVKKDEYEKETAADFALWKFWDEDDGNVFWEGKLAKGRPGWHIECSAMSIRYLGRHIDIHTGAVDLIFPHHENEIAQSEAYTGEKFVNYWIHPEHLLVNGTKMSKSLKNFYTLRDLEKIGFDPLSFRLMCVSTHYRSRMNFTIEELKKYEKTLQDIDSSIKALQALAELDGAIFNNDTEDVLRNFKEATDEDLNTPLAIKYFFEAVSLANKRIKEGAISKQEKKQILDAIDNMDSVLGIVPRYDVPNEVVAASEERKKLRSKKDWPGADKKREFIKQAGYNVIDIDEGRYALVKRRAYGE